MINSRNWITFTRRNLSVCRYIIMVSWTSKYNNVSENKSSFSCLYGILVLHWDKVTSKCQLTFLALSLYGYLQQRWQLLKAFRNSKTTAHAYKQALMIYTLHLDNYGCTNRLATVPVISVEPAKFGGDVVPRSMFITNRENAPITSSAQVRKRYTFTTNKMILICV